MSGWTPTDYGLSASALTGIYNDIQSTKAALQRGDDEYNPLLGSHPSDAKLNVAATLAGAGTILAANEIPDKYRAAFLGGIAGMEHAMAAKNRGSEKTSGFLDSIKRPALIGLASAALAHLLFSGKGETLQVVPTADKGISLTYQRKF